MTECLTFKPIKCTLVDFMMTFVLHAQIHLKCRKLAKCDCNHFGKNERRMGCKIKTNLRRKMNVVEILFLYKIMGMKRKMVCYFQNNSFVSILSCIHLSIVLDLPNYCPETFELML